MTVQDVLSVVQNLPAGAYEALLAATGITLLVQKFKNLLIKYQVEHKDYLYVLVSSTLAFLASLGQYVEAGGGQNWTILGQHTAVVLGVINLVYHFPKIGVKAINQTAQDAKLGQTLRNTDSTATTVVAPSTSVDVTAVVTPNSRPVLEGEF